MSNLVQQLMRHEGYRQYPYTDTVGKLTIGVGRNLDDVGISEDEATHLLENDILVARNELLFAFPAFSQMQPVRQDALINMVFNMGITRFKGFKNMISALVAQNYPLAADEMLDSKWARQVGSRADELAYQMRTNSYTGD